MESLPPELSPTGYLAEVRRVLEHIEKTQADAVVAAGALIADSIAAEGVLQAFGTGHSEALAMEVSGRAGGFVPSNKLALRDLILFGGEPVDLLDDPKVERREGLAKRIYELAPVEPQDVFVIASNSGGNGVIVEMAEHVTSLGHKLIAITSLEHTSRITSRHSSGKVLKDFADVVLDNGAPYGDAVLPLPSFGANVCGISSVGNAVLAQMVIAESVRLLAERGVEAPMYLSANATGSDGHNDALEARYAGRIRRSAS
ncbi:putative phosphosugar-binding protein [Catenulispora sp. EB89]|uniref:sugar isomerase domain-containing protein n=1 Tax=Catenulispora sp. EB89 TaxID=3156257 RepID=UPI0035190AAB